LDREGGWRRQGARKFFGAAGALSRANFQPFKEVAGSCRLGDVRCNILKYRLLQELKERLDEKAGGIQSYSQSQKFIL